MAIPELLNLTPMEEIKMAMKFFGAIKYLEAVRVESEWGGNCLKFEMFSRYI